MEKCLHLLFFCDSPKDATLIVQLLSPAGLAVNYRCTATPQEFREALIEQCWDLVLAQNKAPEFDPYFVLSVCREIELDIPVIIEAEDYSDEIAVGLMDAGASDYISKDQISRLVPAIIRELKRSGLKNDRVIAENIESKKAEALLKQTNERLIRAASVSKSGNWEYDLETGWISGSEGVQKLYGIEGESWDFDEIKVIPLPEYRELLANGLLALVNSGEPYDYEFKIRQQRTDEIIDVHSIAEYDSSRRIIFGVIQDISDRKKIEDALLTSEEKYRILIENQGEGVATVDLNEIFVFANPAADQMFGVPTGTLVNRCLLDFLDLHQVAKIKEQSARRALMEKSSYEIEIVALTGETHHILITATPQTDIQGETIGTFGIFRDITERKKAESELINSEKKYRELANSLPVGIFETDLSGTITFASKTLKEWLNYSEDEVITGFNMVQFILESERARALDRFSDLVEGELQTASEYNAIRKDGSSFPILASACVIKNAGLVTGIRGALTDITEQKSIEDKLRILSQTVEQNPSSIIITDAKGNIEYVNNAFTFLTQYSLIEVIDKPARIFNPGHISEADFDLMWKTLFEKRIWKGEYQNRRKDKSFYWEDVTISSLTNSKGVISNFILVMNDISEKKKLFDDLIRAKESAEESDRLKSAFLAMMNHELRTPLTHILGFSELIMSSVSVEDNISFASSIQSSGQNLLSIIEGVFDLALIDHSKIKLSNQTFSLMDHYMENKASFDYILRTSAKHGQINLIFRPDTHWLSSYITADRGEINQVLTNLFKNAVKFTHEGTIEFGFNVENGSIINFYIKDSGIGIPEEKQSIIFDYFRQVDDSYTRVYGGIGVGLAISKKIAKILQAELKVISKPGEGSIFSLSLPAELSYIKE